MQVSHTIGAHPAKRNFEERHATLGAKPFTAPSEPERAESPQPAQPVDEHAELGKLDNAALMDVVSAANRRSIAAHRIIVDRERTASAGIHVGG